MSTALKRVHIPFHALNHSNVLCSNCECLAALESFYENIVSVVKEADCTLPRRRHGLAKPYWTSELNDLKKKSSDAHKLWLSCDSPRSGPIYNEKIRTNSQYKLMLRKSKRDSNKEITDYLLIICSTKTIIWKKSRFEDSKTF